MVGLSSASRTRRPRRSGATARLAGGAALHRQVRRKTDDRLEATRGAVAERKLASQPFGQRPRDREAEPLGTAARHAGDHRRIDAGALVEDAERGPVLAVAARDQADRSGADELHRVADEVVDHPRQQHRIEAQGHGKPVLDLHAKLQASLARLAGMAAFDLLQEVRDVELRSGPRAGAWLAEGRANQRLQRPGRRGDPLELRARFGVERRGVDPGDAAEHALQRPFQVVAQHRKLPRIRHRIARPVLNPAHVGIDDAHVFLHKATRTA